MAKQSLKKRILNSAAMLRVLSFIVSIAARFLYYTNRVSKQYPPESVDYYNGKKPAIFCFWHGRLIMQPFVKPPRRSMTVLMSQHNDGAIARATMRWFNIGSVRASKNRGTTRALLEMMSLIEAGGNLCITPDGPRGPNQKAATGPAFIAAKTGYPIIPISFAATRHWRLRSWDKFMIPKPFGRITYVGHPPIFVADAEDATLAAATAELEAGLNRITEDTDRLSGITA